MDDAVASDNYGELTIEFWRNNRGRCCRQLHRHSQFTATDDAGNSSSATQTNGQDTTRLSSHWPANYTVSAG